MPGLARQGQRRRPADHLGRASRPPSGRIAHLVVDRGRDGGDVGGDRRRHRREVTALDSLVDELGELHHHQHDHDDEHHADDDPGDQGGGRTSGRGRWPDALPGTTGTAPPPPSGLDPCRPGSLAPAGPGGPASGGCPSGTDRLAASGLAGDALGRFLAGHRTALLAAVSLSAETGRLLLAVLWHGGRSLGRVGRSCRCRGRCVSRQRDEGAWWADVAASVDQGAAPAFRRPTGSLDAVDGPTDAVR